MGEERERGPEALGAWAGGLEVGIAGMGGGGQADEGRQVAAGKGQRSNPTACPLLPSYLLPSIACLPPALPAIAFHASAVGGQI